MKVLYLSCFPDALFKKKIENGEILSQAAQKFNKLYVRGFCANDADVDVVVVCAAGESAQHTVVETVYGKTVTYYFHELKGNVIQRGINRNQYAKTFIKQWAKENQDGIVVIDALIPCALEFSREAVRNGLKVISIVTDLVDFLMIRKSSWIKKIERFIRIKHFYKQFDYSYGFVLLTEPMAERIKIRNRKYIVTDGICDYMDDNAYLCAKPETNQKIFLYTGVISKQFGLDNLVNGFLAAHLEDSVLHLYGPGDYVSEIIEIAKKNDNVRYLGVVPNEVIVSKQREATFLVNPRPVGDEYTKYSFPSKNIEYMRSGRPLITTKLPCISKAYDPYVLYFDDDTVEGISASLKRYAKLESSDLNELGRKAQQFVVTEKNYIFQAKRILDMSKE